MTAAPAEARPYHHGDLRRGLVDAARRILEADGPSALSLRAVAREAGVSPAAPYHHFKDKGELLDAVAMEGWDALGEALGAAKAKAQPHDILIAELGVAYVCFARENPALYRVMYERSRDKDELPEDMRENDESAYCLVRETFREIAGDEVSEMDVELATIAAWCAAHGLAEMSGFNQFVPLKDELGGETNFLRAVLAHLGMFARYARPE
ncbi:MAG TPA: TetR/AcrR family transcriptional regulator [Caulobacteraceae bacterium]|nr:TetR/AcrR family transcriptional regulator [Caulobacteraceae bacterium]